MTAQITDFIECEGRRMRLRSDITLPRKHARIRKVENQVPQGYLTGSTACWRLYVAWWRIRDDALFLAGFTGRYALAEGEPLLAEWFSGEIRLSPLEAETYAHTRYVTRIEREILLQVENGRVISATGPRPV